MTNNFTPEVFPLEQVKREFTQKPVHERLLQQIDPSLHALRILAGRYQSVKNIYLEKEVINQRC